MSAETLLWPLERLVLGFYWLQDHWRPFLPKSVEGWIIAVWTTAVVTAEIVFQALNALSWDSGEFSFSGAIAFFLVLFGVLVWPLGLALLRGAFWLLELVRRREKATAGA